MGCYSKKTFVDWMSILKFIGDFTPFLIFIMCLMPGVCGGLLEDFFQIMIVHQILSFRECEERFKVGTKVFDILFLHDSECIYTS